MVKRGREQGQDVADEAIALAAIAKALGHPARIRILLTLLARQSCIGCDLVAETGLAASTTSEHLRILKDAGLIGGDIVHPRICYYLEPAAVAPLRAFLARVAAAPVFDQERR